MTSLLTALNCGWAASPTHSNATASAVVGTAPERETGNDIVRLYREMERRADALPIERAASRFIVTNDADEVIERVRPLIDGAQVLLNSPSQATGVVQASDRHKVILNNPWGSRRYLELPQGELLPRIC